MGRHRSCAVWTNNDEAGDTIAGSNPHRTSPHRGRGASPRRVSGRSSAGTVGGIRRHLGRIGLPLEERGASLAEYGILAFVVSVAAIGTVALIGPKLVTLLDTARQSMFP